MIILCSPLLQVTVVDNFFTGRKRNVEHWVGHENFEMLHHDIVNPLYIEGMYLVCDVSTCKAFSGVRNMDACAQLSHTILAFRIDKNERFFTNSSKEWSLSF